MAPIRRAAVAGSFYASDRNRLKSDIARYVSHIGPLETDNRDPPLALIVPHAGYIYSGPVAAAAYARLLSCRDKIDTVFVIGPAHHVWLSGIAAPDCQAFETPLGPVPLATTIIEAMVSLSLVRLSNAPHAQEHSLEVQIPFLQSTLSEFDLVPLVVGDAPEKAVSAALAFACQTPASLIVVSTDLSHFHKYAAAQLIDKRTAEAIERCETGEIGPDQACGHTPLCGLLSLARTQRLQIKRLAMENSADQAGSRERVVGYGSWALYRPEP